MSEHIEKLKRLNFRELLMEYVFGYAARVRASEKKIEALVAAMEGALTNLRSVAKKVDELYGHHLDVQRRLHDPDLWKKIEEKTAAKLSQ